MACHIFLIIDERGKCGCPKTALSPSVFSFRATTISLLNLLLGQLGTHSTYIYCPFHLDAPIYPFTPIPLPRPLVWIPPFTEREREGKGAIRELLCEMRATFMSHLR